MKKLLITGFEPFGGETVNPSWLAVSSLPDTVGSFLLCKLQLPTVYREASDAVIAAAEQAKADVVLCVGQAGGRSAVTPEYAALNVRAAKLADNKGVCLAGERIAPDAPDGLFATVPVQKMADAIRSAGLPGEISYHAGTFVCNDVMYSLLLHYRNSAVQVGFIHVPFLPEQATNGQPSLSLNQIADALQAAILSMEE